MIRIGTLAAAALVVAGMSGTAYAQISTQTQDNVGTNAAGSKSGVVGKGDSMETSPSTTGTAVAPGTRMAPDSRGMTNDPSVAPRSTGPVPAR
ncbi:hypothetical protein [uncultured Methylobacterium sp.]|uniref:hypothetical protein n=1 Tax=uncultured Methylobacterium sp. TaxID=157278 RepID=UPI0035C9650E